MEDQRNSFQIKDDPASAFFCGKLVMNYEQIREYCEEALIISDETGIQGGLSFLIGEKFFNQYSCLRNAQNKLKFLFPERTSLEHNRLDDRSFKLSYALTINDNYRDIIEKLQRMEKLLDVFVNEIKESFTVHDIQEYLESYPRFGSKQRFHHHEELGLELVADMTEEEIFSEVEDILVAEDMKKLFLLPQD